MISSFSILSRVVRVSVSTSDAVRWDVGIGGRTVVKGQVSDSTLSFVYFFVSWQVQHSPLTGIVPALNLFSLALSTPE